MEMISERSNKGKGKLIEGDDHLPSQNHLSGSDNQQQNFGGGRGATEAAVPATTDGASSSHSASEKKRLPLSDLVDQTNPHRLQWTGKLHKHFLHAVEELLRRGKKVTPKAVSEEMGIDGITQQHVKSHLQRHREKRITETNWQVPRGTRLKNNKAGKFNGPKSASESASTSSREHDRNGSLYSAQQQHQVDVADISAVNGVCFMTINVQVGQQEQTPDFQAQCLLPAQNGVGLQILTPGFQDQNGVFYPFQPENGNHWVQLTRYCEALGNNQQQNQPQAATVTVQAQNGIYNFWSGDEAHWVQQPTLDGGNLGNIQQQNQAPVATDTVQAQNATANMLDNSSDLDTADFEIEDMFLRESFGSARQNEVYNIQAGNETQMVRQPARDGGVLGNNQQQDQPEAATDTVQAQNAFAIMPGNVVTTGDQLEDFSELYTVEQIIGNIDFSEPFEDNLCERT